jgi:hypothetical protein
VLACYLPYGQFSEWSYLRFLLPAFPAAFALVAAVTVSTLTVLPAAARGATFVTVLTVVAINNTATAAGEQAFHLRDYEARYRLTGHYLAALLPANAVIVSAMESASAHYYTRLPVVRWDLLAIDLDAAVRDLRSAGHPVALLVEDWEVPSLRARFPSSTLARLDWMPRAEVAGATRVGIFDVTDSANPETFPRGAVGSGHPPDMLSLWPAARDSNQPPPPWPER